jgi:tryptophan synthase alpha subunit
MPFTKQQKDQSMSVVERYRFIRSFMVALGVTNARIAQEENVCPEYIYYVLKGKRTGYRIRRAIAKAVNKPVQVLWPDTPKQHCEIAQPP